MSEEEGGISFSEMKIPFRETSSEQRELSPPHLWKHSIGGFQLLPFLSLWESPLCFVCILHPCCLELEMRTARCVEGWPLDATGDHPATNTLPTPAELGGSPRPWPPHRLFHQADPTPQKYPLMSKIKVSTLGMNCCRHSCGERSLGVGVHQFSVWTQLCRAPLSL